MPNNEKQTSELLNHQETDNTKRNQQQLGARILSQVNFESSHKSIVESSFNKALKKGEKLSGKNNERRNLSYLNRLNNLIEKYGSKAEQKLWEASIKDDLLIQYDNIPESYWNAKKQELRDNGYGSVELTESSKHEYYEKERELQRESLEKWVNYLGDEHSPYPLWFKIYAWNGMTKMGKYSKEKKKYETRNETTVAPYPDPDAEILASVFDVINRYYGNNEREFYTEEGERNINLEQIVQSGNFSKIFNAIQQDIAPIIEPPENPEDVHGKWAEYELGDEDDIARAARGTGWCVASSSVGRYYLKYGTYGQEDYYDDNEIADNKAKFILFHLTDPKTDKLSKNACASIRLDPDGNVAEISGLKDGQALNDSLVSIVEEKVRSLPGGEEFLPKFADKKRLVSLDKKMKNDEDLTKEDLEFLYEIHRPINTLDTYNIYDPRIDELKQKYDVEYALNNGVDVNQLVSRMWPDDIAANLDTLQHHGAEIDINQLVSRMEPDDIAANLDTLQHHGAEIDINQLVSRMRSESIAANLDTLLGHKADVNQLVSRMESYRIAARLGTLLDHKADVNQLVSKMTPSQIAANLDTLQHHGAEIDVKQLASQLPPSAIAQYLRGN